MTSLTPILIAKALDGLSARAEATAANIANAGSLNYRPLRVDFEAELRAAADRGTAAVAAVIPRTTVMGVSPYGTEMRVDLELATASATSMRYAALIDLLGREMSMMRAAIAGSR